MRRAFFFIVACLFAATSSASIPRASIDARASEHASDFAAPLSETRVRVSEVLAPFERPAESELTRALRQAYAEASTTNASGSGRFLSVDPGPSDLRRPQTWNRYVYAENNPVKNVDRDGRLSNPVTGEQGRGKPILHRGGGFGEIRKEQPSVKGSAGGEFGAARAGGRTHKGVDIIAPGGTPLVASFSGEAYEIRANDKKLGLSVFVKGKDGIIAIYSHLDSTNLKQGDTVKEGEQVGEAGRSGNVMKEQPASEDHVHFQLYGANGKVTDPETFLNDPKKQEKYRDKDKEEKQQ